MQESIIDPSGILQTSKKSYTESMKYFSSFRFKTITNIEESTRFVLFFSLGCFFLLKLHENKFIGAVCLLYSRNSSLGVME